MQYLINLGDQGIVHDIPDLRERVQQLLNLIPPGKQAKLAGQAYPIIHYHYHQGCHGQGKIRENNDFSRRGALRDKPKKRLRRRLSGNPDHNLKLLSS